MPIRPCFKLALTLGLVLLCAGCGDVFRPVATPLTGSPPDPQVFRLAFTVSINTAGSAGSTLGINVSGDSRFSAETVGVNPVHAALLPGSAVTRIYVANQGDNTVSSYSAGTPDTPVTTTLLPAGAAPNFVASTESTNMYVSMPGLSSVGVIPVASNVLKTTVPLGGNSIPIALAETGDGKIVYSINQGDNTVMGINTADDSVRPKISVGVSPVWATFSSAGLLYVLSDDGTISIIQPGIDTGPVGTLNVAPGGNYIFFDRRLNRLYVTNPTANTVSIFDLSQSPAVLLATVPVPAGPVSVTALADGTRAYVASFQSNGATLSSAVSVINTTNNAVQKTITIPNVPVVATCNSARFRLSTASSPDSTKVYVANCDAGGTEVIRTTDDTLVTTLNSPLSTQFPNPQNPVWILTSP